MSEKENEKQEVEGEEEEEEMTLSEDDFEPILAPGKKKGDPLEETLIEGVYTLPEMLKIVCEKLKDRTAYSWRKLVKEYIVRDLKKESDMVTKEFGEVKDLTYSQVYNMISSLASGFRRYDPNLKKGSRVGLYLQTCKEWMLSCQACLMANITVVTVYANLGFDALIHCVNECELTSIICDAHNLKNIDDHLYKNCPTLKKLIVVGKTSYKSSHFEQKNIYDLLVDGENHHQEFPLPDKDDLAVIMYTSGTTGNPKGVMMLHRHFAAAIAAIKNRANINENDRYVSYLPLAHVLELVVHCACLLMGAHIGFGSPRSLVAKPGGAKHVGDLDCFKPTILVGVPRIYDTIKKGVFAKVRHSSSIKRMLFNYVYGKKIGNMEKGINQVVYLEETVFGPIREMVGGNLRLLVSGGAPLSKETMFFLQSVLGPKCKVIQGYGLTETLAITLIQDITPGTPCIPNNAGEVFGSMMMKLIDVPEMNYFTKNNEGELCAKGNNLSAGYYKLPEKTKEAFGEDGWFKTGDIARYNGDGSFSIIDRKKNLVKLSQGEYVAPEHLEMIYGASKFILPNGICIVANPFMSYIVALILVDVKVCLDWAKTQPPEISEKGIDDLLKDEKMKKAVIKDLEKLATESGKKKFEMVKDCILLNEEWTSENNMLTASSKLKRRTILEHYDKELKAIYSMDEKVKSFVDLVEDDDEEEQKRLPKYFYQLNPNWFE